MTLTEGSGVPERKTKTEKELEREWEKLYTMI
jgi:hypothetical protein